MTPVITPQALAELTAFHGHPCLSLYQPTHRHHPENQQDPLRFRQLVKALETSLRQQQEDDAVRSLLAPFEALAGDAQFWNHTLDGLAVMVAADFFRVYRLQRPVAELAVVADSFHTKPLRRMLQTGGRLQLLGLNRHRVQLFEGDRDALDEIELTPEAPATADDTPGAAPSEPYRGVSSHGGIGAGHAALHHGQGGRKDETDDDTERFFRAVDRAVLAQHSRPSGLPLMLAALPGHHHLFRQISHNPFLMADGLTVNPEALDADTLRERAWQAAEPAYEARTAAWLDAYGAAAAAGLGSGDLATVARAAVAGRVDTLLIEADRELSGRIDPTTGRIDEADLDNPRADDVLDHLGAWVERMGGVVHVLDTARMPGSTGLAATFRHA
ncbi:MAG: hypothetical protein Q7U73_03435 [Rubrivivax sp.]|nr:hypothetical protein [Rubrivivax sp.]